MIDPIEEDISRGFGRLDLQTISCISMNPVHQHPFLESIKKPIAETMPMEFKSYKEALKFSIAPLKRCFLVLKKSLPYTRSEGALDPLDPEREAVSRICRQWINAYTPYFEETKLDCTSRRYFGAHQLITYFRMFEILIPTSSNENEKIYDDFVQDFRYILSSQRDVIEGGKSHESLTLIIPLYVTAIKCRDSSLRREAILLLRNSPRRNGVWDSAVVAKVAAWVVFIDEEGMDDNGYVPEEFRTRGGSLTFYMQDGWIRVSCQKD
jgi:hypothetical protein